MSVTRGSIIPLDRKVGDLVDIVVNDKIVARGEVVVLDEEAPRFAISVREVVQVRDD
jgi:flagellar motor switch protein FliN/FliY